MENNPDTTIINSNPNPEIEFNINTNLGVPEKLWNRFVEKITYLVRNKCVQKFTVFTSVDAWGEKAEYLRTGLDFELFKKRFEELLNIGNIRVTTMCAFNMLSITSMKDLLEWHLYLKKKYNPSDNSVPWERDTGITLSSTSSFSERALKNPDHFSVAGIDIPYLRHPSMLDAQYVTPDLIQQYLVPAINFMSENTSNSIWTNHQGFETYELEKFKRICLQILYRSKNQDQDMAINRAKFFDFINEMDKRNNTNFIEVFPEMKEFYEICKSKRANLIIG